MRRVELSAPRERPSELRVEEDVESMVAWLDGEVPRSDALLRVGLITMSYAHDFPLRYLLGLEREDLDVASLTDPRFRRDRYPGLQPGLIDLLVWVDEGFEEWPPTDDQRAWLRANIHCQDPDPLTPFLAALLARGPRLVTSPDTDLPPFYVFDDRPMGQSSQPGMRWAMLAEPQRWSQMLPPPQSRICAE
jgi:hypothetical protein